MDVFNLQASIGLSIDNFKKNLEEARQMLQKGLGSIPEPKIPDPKPPDMPEVPPLEIPKSEVPEPSKEPIDEFEKKVRETLNSNLSDIVRLAAEKAKETASNVVQALRDLPSNVVEKFKNIGSGVANAIKSIPSKFKELGSNILSGIKSTTENVVVKFAEMGHKVVDTIKSIPSKFKDLASNVGNAIKSIPSKFVSIVQEIPGKIKSGLTSLKDLIVSGFKSAAEKAGEALKQLPEKAKEVMSATADKIKNGFETIAKVSAVALGAATTAVAALTKTSLDSYASYEQLVGGVDTLFKESSSKVQDYANQAYTTAGLSANEYMETATSFSASLLQGLGGDTDKAADIANQAIVDMSDNANKMG